MNADSVNGGFLTAGCGHSMKSGLSLPAWTVAE